MRPTVDKQSTGIVRQELEFTAPALRGYRWSVVEIVGRSPGPRLCVTAGVHVNEVSSIEAAVRLQSRVDPNELRGTLSIMPVVNLPALYEYTEYNCPIDGKNINFTFPGRRDGSFSEALCHALLHEWAAGADCYVDLHGGDLREEVSRFIMYQRVGDPEADRRREQLARCFDADIVVGFGNDMLGKPGRPPTACADLGMDAVMSEAGANGRIDETSVDFHVTGVLRIAERLGMIEGAGGQPTRPQHLCYGYEWLPNPVDGMFHADVTPGQWVDERQCLGQVRGFTGETLETITAPVAGYVLWIMTQPILKAGTPALAIAVPAPSDKLRG